MRINRFLSEAGVASRRKADDLIRQGRIKKNGVIIQDLGVQVDPDQDQIEFDDLLVTRKLISKKDQLIALNKPAGYLTSHDDKHHDQTIFQLLPPEYGKFKFAGRLDLQTRGLIFLSDSGDLIQELTHPSKGPEKEYEISLQYPLDAEKLAIEFRVGIRDQGETLRAASVSPDSGQSKKFRVVLEEGKKRQLRRMFSKMGGKLIDLQRVRVGNCRLESLQLNEGEWCWVEIKKIL